jgi:8-hydroxy-5-deazaflavin:NADPH oxidoreductase
MVNTPEPVAATPPDLSALTIGVVGGTGPQGRGLALRWVAAGLRVIIGSRDANRAQSAAAELASLVDQAGTTVVPGQVSGDENSRCAAAADIVLVAVPFDGHAELVRTLRASLAGKIVVDCVNALGFDRQGPYPLRVSAGSAAQQASGLLPESRVTAAFHHVSAVTLADLSVDKVDLDVLVLGDDRAATDQVRSLAETIPGVRGIYGGRLRNAGQVEALTANLIAINRRYKTHAGIRITDLP